ncbi:MAG: GMP synthase [Desulfuromonas sp.]|nr:MAG: GMP synthase [Desulfuromonas sp.]
MKSLYIAKVGTTFSTTAQQFGDFDQWTAAPLADTNLPIHVLDIQTGADFPQPDECAGLLITGSHAMVTDELPWSLALEEWIRVLLREEIPLFGICYGHQLLAKAAGGVVDYHPAGKEIGTVEIHCQSEAATDPLFHDLPQDFTGHTTHSQSVLELPPGAVRLAANNFEPNHAFRHGCSAWGVQFHPEYSTTIMRAYIEEQATELEASGRDLQQLLAKVRETPIATLILKRFAEFAAAKIA